MRVELSNLDEKTFNRAKAQLDAAEIEYLSYAARRVITYEGEPANAKRFVSVALHDPDAKVYR